MVVDFGGISAINATHFLNQTVWTTQNILDICDLPSRTILRLALFALGLWLTSQALSYLPFNDLGWKRIIEGFKGVVDVSVFLFCFITIALYWLSGSAVYRADIQWLSVPCLLLLATVALRYILKRRSQAPGAGSG